jgi:hypothetical protein
MAMAAVANTPEGDTRWGWWDTPYFFRPDLSDARQTQCRSATYREVTVGFRPLEVPIYSPPFDLSSARSTGGSDTYLPYVPFYTGNVQSHYVPQQTSRWPAMGAS